MSLLNKHIVELLTEDQFTTVQVYFHTGEEVRSMVPQQPEAPRAYPGAPAPAPWAPPGTFALSDIPARTYTYKVSKELAAELKKGDIVVVPSDNSGHRKAKLGTVWQVSPTAAIDYNAGFDYKWIISKVDMSEYNAHITREIEFKQHLEENEKERQRQVMRDTMLARIRPVDPTQVESFRKSLQLLGVDADKFEAPKAD